MNGDPMEGQAAPDRSLTTVVYGLQALYFVSGVALLAAGVINYWKRDAVRGTWLESHFRWQIDTFWCLVAGWVAIVALPFVFLLGVDAVTGDGPELPFVLMWIACLLVLHAWYVYRIVKGWTRLNGNQPV